ncbi:glutamine-synthetase adenylyltransferase [Thermocrinis minervae]|uniref:Glutamate-ammonia-ligase adenylyltransferase n=1 Tax=Thermocrinis minervae TaxID=381751 RepID=A0A1M6QQM7_9AQUI|nr:glutamine-synthetase adenylyltransferase [Thermocrinis minervae]SHK22403.1 glutamate-ammonia-ligase adenylyltransferase [Thermocrinis minervae]
MFPSEWFEKAKGKLLNPQRAKESLEELLKRHPDPQSLISYLNERRFILLLELLDRSECIRKFLINHPEDFQNTIPGLWYVRKKKEDYLKELKSLLSDSLSDEKFSERLAYYRHRELMRLLSKEILGTAKLEDILHEYSELPDAMLECAYERALSEYTEKYGKPLEENGKEVTGCIIALGKLGSYELNYYSDIDLMFIHSSDNGQAGKLTLNEFFSKVFQKVFTLMNTVTPEGKPYEVDLDLRPFGRSGPISMSVRSAELYYESYGRVWERFALLRARFCAGDKELYEVFEREVKNPFVFRKSIDYKVIEEIKLLKAQILAQSKKRVLNKVDVKTGEGGIREVEFAVQALVLLLGGKNPFLRESNTFRAIWKLNQKGIFSNEQTVILEKAYEFLRRLEHTIQMFRCTQTHSFSPNDVDALAFLMGLSREEFERTFRYYTSEVSKVFEGIMPEERPKELDPIQQAILTEDENLAREVLSAYGFKNPLRAYSILVSYIHGKEGVILSSEEKKKFIELLPSLIKNMSMSTDPDETLINFDKFFSNPTGRKVVLSPAKEDVNQKLCKVFSLSSYLSNLISRNPDLVEDVLTLYQDFPEEEKLTEEFEKYKQTLNLSPENLFRRFKKVWEVRIALVYLLKKDHRYKKLMDFFASLTMLADFLLKKAYQFLELDGILLLSLGKYGSAELSIGSDLDLVFVSSQVDYELTKKAQNFVRFLTTHTSEGYLYDVDFRLRPMGTKGELLPPLEFYREYFRNTARTWERLAWTRCRYVVGPEYLKEEMEKLLTEFLFEKPVGKKEREEIKQMRHMLEGQAKKGKDLIDLKFSPGGLLDGEFIIQYYIILEGLREPSMIRACQKLMEKHSILKDVYQKYMFLRLVETRLRLSKERAGSVLHRQDLQRLASSLGMDVDEFSEELFNTLKGMRELFLEVFG